MTVLAESLTTSAAFEDAAVHIFVGPTLSEQEALEVVPGAVVHPPVAHGDLLTLDVRPGDVVVIIDGYYHQRAPVRHKEILHLVDQGVRVIGCASMGALRAAELAAVGMIGYGRVFEMYAGGEIDADDEVAIAHLRVNSFEARNVPLVNVRSAAAAAIAAGALLPAQGEAVVAAARSLHYTDRSWRQVFRVLAASAGPDVGVALTTFLVEHPEAGDLKRCDALRTLADLPEIIATTAPSVPGHWRNRHLYQWLPEFTGGDLGAGATETGADPDGADGTLVSDADVLRHEQVYGIDFPARWRTFAVGEASRAPGITSNPSHQAVAREVFGRSGAIEAVLSTGNPFLTPLERADLPDDEALIRTLVRCFVPPRGLYDVLARMSLPANADDIRATIRQAKALNDQVLWRNRIRLVERLSPARLQRHLEGLWGVPTGDETLLLAAAQDRGLPSIAEAIATVRPYFLRDDALSRGSMAARWGVPS